MEKIIVEPRSVRGLGNIVDTKQTREFGEYNSNMGSFSNTTYGTVFTMTGITGSYLSLSYSNVLSEPGDLTVTATLKKSSDNSVITSASLSCYFDDKVLTATTNSSGVATFTLPVAEIGLYTFRVIWTGTHNTISGCLKLGRFYCGDTITGLELYEEARVLDYNDTLDLVTLSEPAYPGATVTYLTYNPELFTFTGTGSSGQVPSDGSTGWTYTWTYGTEADGVFTVGSSYTRLRAIGNTRYVYTNLSGTSTGTYDYYPEHLEVSLDVTTVSGSADLVITTASYGTSDYQTYIKALSTGTSVRAVLENDEWNYYVDDELIETVEFSTDLTIRVGLRATAGSYVDFKNFKIGGF